ncbi:hypothetical protein [Thalassotalea castellviae]|uniref:DUF2092 domain-containing protein n=1 Tax=Thalassotalea castellviae TaxID=3075612 RepID=A0ABU3A4K7_9GAMM|nr:hypothetical protein [Thalassotalea sp. W431]MDT0604889.1 hypothetical protein [Thalassotalea sp. W431]
MELRFSSIVMITSFFSLSSFNAYADGLTDLKSTLLKFTGDTPISAIVESAYTEKRGKKKKQKTKKGLIQVNLSEDNQGLKLIYSNETISKLEQEAEQKEHDDEANTPTLNAVNGVGVAEMSTMLSAAPNLLRTLKKATFVSEEVVTHNEENVRQLNFTLPLEAIIDNKEVHEYVDEFKSEFNVLINQSGTPIQSSITFDGSGSAYIFFTMDLTQTNTFTYKEINNRLVNIKKTFKSKRSSTWGDTESEGYKVLIPHTENSVLAALH